MNIIASTRTAECCQVPPAWPPGYGSVLLRGVRWSTYEALLNDVGNDHIRLTYDRGTLEIMAPLFRHEGAEILLGELVKALARAEKLPIKSAGSTTFRRWDVERGLEPDRCFYIRNISAILGKDDIKLPGDPPPDLAIEVDVEHRSLDRLPIYAALGVPEVWRFAQQRLEVLRRRDEYAYESCAASPTFPHLPIDAVPELLQELIGLDDASQEQRLRAWVRRYASGAKHARRGKKK